jgi:hypothetical protein
MKKLLAIFVSLILLFACSTSKEAGLSRAEARKEKKAINQGIVKNAIESRRYIVKLNRLYFRYGGMAELIPRANFIIIDGDRAIISTAYLGRQYDIKPIAGINMRGMATDYALTDNLAKGSFQVKLRVNNGGNNSFDVYIDVARDGYCTASVSSLKIDNIRYSGYVVPISGTINPAQEEGDRI